MATKSAPFLTAVETRRTYYQISAKSLISDDAIKTIVETAVKHVPSSFNIQSGRAILFLGEANQRVWALVKEHYLASLSDEGQVKMQSKKIDEYAAGYGCVAYFEDQAILDAMYEKMPYFKASKSFEVWSENSTGMLQFAIWTALEAEGFGASLQHHASYVNTIDPALQKEFELPTSWKCTAIMPFGVPVGEPGNAGHPKTFEPIESRVKVFSK